MDLNSDSWIVLILIGAILLNSFYDKLNEKILFAKEKIISLFYLILKGYIPNLIFFLIFGILLVYILRNIYFKIRDKRRKIFEEKAYIEEIMGEDINLLNYQNLKDNLKKLKKKYFLEKYPELKIKIIQIENFIINLNHKNDLNFLEDRKCIIKREIFELEEEKKKLRQTKQQEIALLKSNLDIGENKVFEKSKLNKIEIEILLRKGYKQVNEYCVFQKRVITVLVKPPLNHSVTHAFLVWSVKKLLKKYDDIENIIEHETRDADLTFRIKDKIFAIEIETGTLLKKKKQLNEKINFLNSRYKNNWLIVVSKRDLVQKYKKFGRCSQRKWVCENLKKMFKN